MILSQVDLRERVDKKEVVFDPPLEEKQWGEASVDLRLGFRFIKINGVEGITISVADGLEAIGDMGFWSTKDLKDKDEFGKPETLDLAPNDFVLALTHESVTVPRNLIALIQGRSTYARMGLSVHQTAPWIQPGWRGRVVLEMKNHGPNCLKLTPLVDQPCQVTFFELRSEVPEKAAYGSRKTDRYMNQDHPLKHSR